MQRRGHCLQFDTLEYGKAWNLQRLLIEARVANKIEDCLILLQHPPTFTFGRRYKEGNLITNKLFYEKNGFSVYKTDRGGLATYHGPGQAVCYPILKMNSYTKDFYEYLRLLEEVMIRTLSDFGISAMRKEGYTGVWVQGAKIGFIGVRIAMGYTMHGFSLNIHNDLQPFTHITPCGIQGIRITSLADILNNVSVNMHDIYEKIGNHFSYVFQIQLTPTGLNEILRCAGCENHFHKMLN